MNVTPITPGQPPANAPAPAAGGAGAELSFWDLVDIINPLQHIPIVSSIYRAITGDEMKAPMGVIGGGLYGGPIGAAIAVINAIIEDTTGSDVVGHAFAMAPGNNPAPDAPVLAAAGSDDLPFAPVSDRRPAATANPPILAGEVLIPAPRSAVTVDALAPPAGARESQPTAPVAAPAPAWVAQALAQAEAVHGDGPGVPPTAQPWFTEAMLHAMDKYAAMARSRTGDQARGAVTANR